jgi:ankyrin repeat protein
MVLSKTFVRGALAALMLTVAAPAVAQHYSEGYLFLEAVKKREGDKVTAIVSRPGSTAINTRDKGSGEGALHYVVRKEDVEWLTFLLGSGARPDLQSHKGVTPLSLAVQSGSLEAAEILLRRKATVDLADNRGETPLMYAVRQRNLPMVRLLLSHGANPKRTDMVGYSAIDYAKRDARSEAIVKLLETQGVPAKAAAGPKL